MTLTEVNVSERKRKKRWGRRVLLIFLCAAAAFIVSCGFIFKTKEITYEGNELFTDEELTKYIFNWDKNNTLLYCLIGNKNREVPFVDSYRVDIKWPNRINVTVYERPEIGYFYYAGYYMYVDSNGKILDKSLAPLVSAPVLEVPKIVSFEDKEKPVTADEAVYDSEVLYADIAKKNNVSLDKIYSTEEGLFLSIKEVQVKVGNTKNAEDKIRILGQMYGELDGKKGILYLNDYDGRNSDLFFKKT